MKSTFSVIYYLKRQVVKKDGTVPVMGRITVDGSQTQFSCKLTVDPKLWDTKGGRVTGRSSAALETNRMLDKMRVRINKHYQEIMERDNFVTAEKVKNAFLGLEHRYHTLMQVFRQHNEDYEKQVDAGMKAKGTLLKYRTVYKHLQEFLTIRYRVKDIALKELTPAFISDFEMFLRTDKHCCTNTVWLYVCPLRTMVFIAINNEWLTRDPFREYEIKKEETTRSFLTKEEIRLLMEGRLKNAKQELYRDLYLFCAFTGLSFADMRNLTEENIHTYFDEHEWININRQKTGVVPISACSTSQSASSTNTGVCAGTAGFSPFPTTTRALPESVPSPSVAASPSTSRGIRADTRQPRRCSSPTAYPSKRSVPCWDTRA